MDSSSPIPHKPLVISSIIFITVAFLALIGIIGYTWIELSTTLARQQATFEQPAFNQSPNPSAPAATLTVQTINADPTTSTNAIELNDTAYVHPTEPFSLRAPKGWQQTDRGQFGTLVIFFNPAADQQEDNPFAANINVVSEEVTNTSLEAYVEKTKKSLDSVFQNYTLLSDEEVRINSQPARLIVNTFRQGAFDLQDIQLFYLQNNRVYIVTATALATTWSRYAPLFNASLRTFSAQ